MAIQADLIVVGEPLGEQGDDVPARYRVTKVLKGGVELVGEELALSGGSAIAMTSAWSHIGREKGPVWKIKKALLFLTRGRGKEPKESYRLVLSGARVLSEKGVILVPKQFHNPGPLSLVADEAETWEGMQKRVREDLPRIREIRDLETIEDLTKRNEVIFKWIEEHKDELGGGYLNHQKQGWASLERALFDWIQESCRPEDCWKAMILAAELKTGPERSHPSFCSKEGRALLVAKTFDETLPESRRLKALERLGRGGAYWYAHRRTYPATRVVSKEEQVEIIDRVLPLLHDERAAWRAAAARCLSSVSWPYDANFKEMTSKRAIPNLVELYRREKDAKVLEIAIEAIRRIETKEFWKELSGNPAGIVVLVRCAEIDEEMLTFDVNLDHTWAKLVKHPKFKFEKQMEDESYSKAVFVQPSPVCPEDLFEKGWGGGHVRMTIPAGFAPGVWRVTLEGVLGEETWRSEAIEVLVPSLALSKQSESEASETK